MSCNISDRRKQRKSSKIRLHSAITTVALVVSNGITFSESFGPATHTASAAKSIVVSQRVPTRRFFRNNVDSTFKTDGVFGPTEATTNFISASLLAQETDTTPIPDQTQQMPSWLNHADSHLYEEKWNSLRVAMKESFFTDSEISQLEFAIVQASAGIRDKMSGAMELCLILVETMEMGLTTLIAAAFHYCSCVATWERTLLLPPEMATAAWDAIDYDHSALAQFGQHAVLIAEDAARLKKLEMVAGMIIRNSEKPRRVTPNAEDAGNFKNLLLTETKDWRALAIRSAAALYRMRGLMKLSPTVLTPEASLVAREALYIYAPLASRLGMHRLKNELEGAAFRILYRRQYEKVNSLAREERSFGSSYGNPASIEMPGCSLTKVDIAESMKNILTEVKYEMTQMLANDQEFCKYVSDFSVSARVKEPYSMWKKMLKCGTKHILEVPDAVALRIIIDAKQLSHDEPIEVRRARERALCYYAQSLCQQRWQPCRDDSRFKDYIENPKRNGYQSLHYTACTSWGGEDWSMEIQIRTGEMHQVAEFGLASHWDYKAERYSSKVTQQPDINVLDQSTDSYLRSLKGWHWQQNAGATTWDSEQAQSKVRANLLKERTKRLEPYLEALKVAGSDFTHENVFVFISPTYELPEGKVLSLPASACVLDALRELERQLNFSIPWKKNSAPVSCNGAAVGLTTKLHNGDILEWI